MTDADCQAALEALGKRTPPAILAHWMQVITIATLPVVPAAALSRYVADGAGGAGMPPMRVQATRREGQQILPQPPAPQEANRDWLIKHGPRVITALAVIFAVLLAALVWTGLSQLLGGR